MHLENQSKSTSLKLSIALRYTCPTCFKTYKDKRQVYSYTHVRLYTTYRTMHEKAVNCSTVGNDLGKIWTKTRLHYLRIYHFINHSL
jgi:hypothetical protein